MLVLKVQNNTLRNVSQGNAIVLLNFSYALPVYGTSDSDLSVIENFLDPSMKRKFLSKNVNIRDFIEKADITLCKKKDRMNPNARSSGFYLRKRT